jgi:hypothetical protein
MFGKKKDNGIDDILADLGMTKEITVNHKIGRLSDPLCNRDSFFHSCWTRLKFERPELFEAMAKVEIFIAGYNPEPEPEDESDTEDEIDGEKFKML